MTPLTRRHLLVGGAALAGGTALGTPPAVAAPKGQPQRHISPNRIRRWAHDTWQSLVAMTDESTGLTADNIEGSLTSPRRSGYTSPTNIGGYLWSALVARDLKLISSRECSSRLAQTLSTLATMRRNDASGMYYNWYDEKTGDVLTTWPTDGTPVNPFLSSVDNGWLAAALIVVANADPSVARSARLLLEPMDFAAYYNPTPRPDLAAGLMRGGFWEADPPDGAVEGNYLGRGPNVFYTGFHYDTTVSETRIASYIAIARRQVPAAHYFATWRTFPDGCDWSWQEQKPVGGVTRRYLGVDVFEGAYTYRGMHIVPGWGGSMFEALMPNMFVPEERWAPRSWGVNHPLMVRAHREHGLQEAGYGFWGFSPASKPGGGYREYGVDALGLNPDGYFSDVEETNVDVGYAGDKAGDPPCRVGTNPNPDFGNGVVTPHALFLAMHHEPYEAYQNLVKLERELDVYAAGGFYDAVAVGSGLVAQRYLSLDQAMVMGSIGNVFGNAIVRRAFVRGAVSQRIRPLIGMERFSAGLVE